MGKLLYTFRRLREPSSLAAISSMMAMVGYQLPTSSVTTVVNFLAVAFGIAGVWVKEGSPETEVEGF